MTGEEELVLASRSPEDTERLGRLMAGLLRGGELLCLVGELGAGKTVFVRGLADRAPVLDAAAGALVCRAFPGGELRLPGSGPILVGGKAAACGHFPRHDGSLARSAFGSGVTEVSCGGDRARLAVDAPLRASPAGGHFSG